MRHLHITAIRAVQSFSYQRPNKSSGLLPVSSKTRTEVIYTFPVKMGHLCISFSFVDADATPLETKEAPCDTKQAPGLEKDHLSV